MQPQSHSQAGLRQGMVEEVLERNGFVRLCVFGESMLPSIWPGDVVSVESSPAARIEVGEVILFRKRERFFLHRVHAIFSLDGSLRFKTRGDSAPQDYPPIHESEVLGKVVQVQGNRKISSISGLRLHARVLGRILCHCGVLRSVALTIHSQSGNGTEIGHAPKSQPVSVKSPVLFASE